MVLSVSSVRASLFPSGALFPWGALLSGALLVACQSSTCKDCEEKDSSPDESCGECDDDSDAGSANSGGTSNGGGSGGNQLGSGGFLPTGPCATPEIRIREVEVGVEIDESEDEVNLRPLALSPVPGGGSRLGFMGTDGNVHVADLNAGDEMVGEARSFDVHDFQDIYADETGGYLLVTRDAEGGGTLGCGDPTNLCGTPPNPAVPCHDMYMLRFEGDTESWATKLTSSSAALPPYSTGKTGPEVFMIWWYAHHGRLASDGTNVAAYFGAAISVSENSCINIHQGDRMKIVTPEGEIASGGFDWGCSHSGYERVLWDPDADKYVSVCKTDNQNRLAIIPGYETITPVDLAYSNMSDLARDASGGYWVATSDAQAGEPELAEGHAEVSLHRFQNGASTEKILLAGAAGENARAPYLAEFGQGLLAVAWETSDAPGDLRASDPERRFWLQVRDRSTGEPVSEVLPIALRGNRYQALRSYPDGSVAYAAPGDTPTSVKVLRVFACDETE